MQILKEDTDYNFIGSVEARDIVEGNCSVVVCDAFVGNVVLKMYEGVGKMLLSEITDTMKHSGPLALLAALLLKKPLKKRLKKFDAKAIFDITDDLNTVLKIKGAVDEHGNSTTKVDLDHKWTADSNYDASGFKGYSSVDQVSGQTVHIQIDDKVQTDL